MATVLNPVFERMLADAMGEIERVAAQLATVESEREKLRTELRRLEAIVRAIDPPVENGKTKKTKSKSNQLKRVDGTKMEKILKTLEFFPNGAAAPELVERLPDIKPALIGTALRQARMEGRVRVARMEQRGKGRAHMVYVLAKWAES